MKMNKKLTEKEKLEKILGIHSGDDVDLFAAWTKEKAVEIARDENIQLTDRHWDVIDFLRVYYQNVGKDMPSSHEFSKTLDERFSEEGGLKYLFKLFPGGPVAQGSRIAGLPVPDDAVDSSFGSLH
jgi:tRNA 2-thiouridine synthesizing protein E